MTKLSREFHSKARGAGATTWMLEHLLDSVSISEPHCVVVSHSNLHAIRLRNIFRRMLTHLNITHEEENPKVILSPISVGNSKVVFMSIRRSHQKLKGLDPCPCGLYVDNGVFENCKQSKKIVTELIESGGSLFLEPEPIDFNKYLVPLEFKF